MAYSKTNWVNGQAPALNATNLNKIEQGIYEADITANTANSKADAIIEREQGYELKSNKVTSLGIDVTDEQYPSAKCVSDSLGNLGTAVDLQLAGKEDTSNKVTTVDSSATDTQYPSALAVRNAIGNSAALKESLTNKAQDLSSPSTSTYPSTQAVADAMAAMVTSGTYEPKVYDGNGTEVTSGLNRYGFYTQVGNVCFFRLELEATSADVAVGMVELPVERRSSVTRQHGISSEPNLNGYLFNAGSVAPPTPVPVFITTGQHGVTAVLSQEQTINYTQGQILSIEGWYICG